MKDNEKQIEEMDYDISYVDNNGYYYDEDGYQQDAYANCHKIAEELIKKGWIKLPKDSVVLSGEQCVEIVQDNYNIGYERGCKETAQKFYEFAKAWFEYYEQNDYFEEVKNLAKQFDVEIKE